jgi:hypothetical protein
LNVERPILNKEKEYKYLMVKELECSVSKSPYTRLSEVFTALRLSEVFTALRLSGRSPFSLRGGIKNSNVQGSGAFFKKL